MSYWNSGRRALSAMFGTVLVFCCLLPGQQARAAEESLTDAQTRIWCPVTPEEIRLEEPLAITVTEEERTWALSWDNGEGAAPDPVPVTRDEDRMLSDTDTICWQLRQEEEGLVLSPLGGEDWLYTDLGRDALRVGQTGPAHWEFQEDTLQHCYTGWYLHLNTERSIWCARSQPEQSLTFWQEKKEDTEHTVTAVPAEGEVRPGDTISLACQQEQTVIYYATSPDGEFFTEETVYTQPILVPEGITEFYVRTWLVWDSGKSEAVTFGYPVFCPGEEEPEWELPYRAYFGQLHGHSALSDGQDRPAEAYRQAKEAGLDFYALTDHSDSFDNDHSGSITQDGSAISEDWAEGKAAGAAATDEGFVGIFGYELSWPEGKNLGHIGTFATPGWQSWKQEEISGLEGYYEALCQVPQSIGQFQHPGTFYGTFQEFSHRKAAYDRHMALLEIGGEEGIRFYERYLQALDAGWHVAPANNPSSRENHGSGRARTVILSDSLSETSLYEAIRARRVYASEDPDLEIYYTVNGCPIGSVLGKTEEVTFTAWLQDPSDGEIGYVEVLGKGGRILEEENLTDSWNTWEMTLPGTEPYYYLKITQADGDVAVTAPVWLETYEDLGVSEFRADRELSVSGEEVMLEATIFNEELSDFTLTSVEILREGERICFAEAPGKVASGETLTLRFPYVHEGLGKTELTLRTEGIIAGEKRYREESLVLQYHSPVMVGDILLDRSHGGLEEDRLSRLCSLAEEADLTVTEIRENLPSAGKLLIIPAPKTDFRPGFGEEVKAFLEQGGSLILLGASGKAEEWNTLLSSLGSDIRYTEGKYDLSFPALYHPDSFWTRDLTENRFYYHREGCAVEGGTWLVREPESGAGLLNFEETAFGGGIFAAGGPFLGDRELPVPANTWDPPSANQEILEKIFGLHRTYLDVSTIAQARAGEEGALFRVRGYATTGTSNPYTTFPEMLCIQDSTGGIPLQDFTDTGIQLGTLVDAVGYRETADGNILLKLIDYSLPAEDRYRWVPETISCKRAMDYALRGGELLQVEGEVIKRTLTKDGAGVSRFTLRDFRGGIAEVVIGDAIFSGSLGTNTLAEQVRLGETVRAMGVLFLEEGTPVLRVRNCEEVVYVPPLPDLSNPKTGDPALKNKCK